MHRRRLTRACARSAQPAPFGYPCFSACPHLSRYIAGARQTTHPRVASLMHGIGTRRRGVTGRILRIASMLVNPGSDAERRGTERARVVAAAVSANGHYSDMVHRLFSPGEWRNGRRAGFRCQCPSGRGGSSPPSPTMSGSDRPRGKGHELLGVRGLRLGWSRCGGADVVEPTRHRLLLKMPPRFQVTPPPHM